MDIFILIAGLTWIIFWILWFICAWITRSEMKQEAYRKREQAPWIRVFFLLGVVLCFWILLAPGPGSGSLVNRLIPGGTVIQLAGLVIMFLGIGFAFWARYHLGKNWSAMPAIRADHRLIRSGPYRFVRHPIYSGLLFSVIGTVIIIGNLVTVIAFIVICFVFLWKIHVEEVFLTGEFGDVYREYKNEVAALIPFLI